MTPGETAVIASHVDGTTELWTFERIAAASRGLACALAAEGLVKGDRVLLLLSRTPHWHVAMTACMHLGLVPVPCVTQLTSEEIRYRAQRSDARGAISEGQWVGRFSDFASQLVARFARGGAKGWRDLECAMSETASPPEPAKMTINAPALMYFTSGSSGLPKAVMQAARGVLLRGLQPWRQLGLRPGDIVWSTSDTGWTRAGSCLLFGPWINGAVPLMHENPAGIEQRLEVLEKFGVTVFAAVTTELRLILATGKHRPLPQLRCTLSAGEAMTVEMSKRWLALTGVPLLVGYGQTETPTATLTDPAMPAVNGMIGRPIPGNTVAIVDADGNECACGTLGNIAFGASDPGLMLGYWKDGGAQLELLAGRWHLSGDSGWSDAEGNLYFAGRNDDIISSSGYRIGPTEIENALARHPAVAECAVVASPDALRGEVVKAFVVLRPGHPPTEALAGALQDYVKASIAPYKYPRRIEFTESLPRTATGKVQRRTLREIEFGQGR